MSDLERAHDLVLTPASSRALTAPEFHQLAQVLPAADWFANIDNPNTRRAYRNDLQEFMTFVGITTPEELRLVTRAHIVAWRKDIERRELAGARFLQRVKPNSSAATTSARSPTRLPASVK